MTDAFDRVTLITVTYQSAAIIPALAETLRRFPNVIVVDNASRDGTAQALSSHLPHAKIIANTVNLGFGPANNQAVALVETPYALLLNPDCIISPEALQRLLATADFFPSAAIVAPQGWRSKTRAQPSYRHAFYERRAKRPYHIPDGVCAARWLHGCCMLVRVEAFRRFAGFDERFFLYYEDDDLCLRAYRAGYECLLEPQADVLHVGGASSAPSVRTDFLKNFYFFRSRHLIIRKYLGRRAALHYRIRTALAAPLAAPLYLLLLRRRYALKWLAWGCSAWNGVITD